MNANYTVLVNTTDSFEDCWEPFFKLFKKYWPEYQGEIYLNTENKEFSYDSLNIISIKNRLSYSPWSECLRFALKSIEKEYLIYIQEDYFFHSRVNNSLLDDYYKKFVDNNWACLHLTDQCTSGPFKKNVGIDGVWEIEKGAHYRLSTQAAFWNKESLLRVIRNGESGWQFEHYGNKRADILLEKVMCVSQDDVKINENEIIPYIFTGIIKGQWNPKVKSLFNSNGLQIDFYNRGFYSKQISFISRVKRLLMIHKRVKLIISLLLLKLHILFSIRL